MRWVAVLAVAALGCSTAQRVPEVPAAASITREFAAVLLRTGTTDLRPGELPAEIPAVAALAEGLRVIGSVKYSDQFGGHTSVGLVADRPVTEAREWFERRILAAGWTVRPPSASSGARGFTQAYSQSGNSSFCWVASKAALSVQTSARRGDSAYIVLDYFPAAAGRSCVAPLASEDGRPVNALSLAAPRLVPPDGTLTSSAGSSGGGTDWESSAEFVVALTPTQMLAHFDRQLRAQGWTIVEQIRGNTMAMAHATKTAPEGAFAVTLTLQQPRSGTLHGSMRIIAAGTSR